ncbi:MAG: glycosyltransferase, partial [Myxococcota bacterium]|nr:glycosyltransferase [Myxococcota bacterium]
MFFGDVQVLCLYMSCLGCLCVFGVHRLLTLWRYLQGRKVFSESEPLEVGRYPFVTVQLPVFNERYVVTRLIEAVVGLEWPRDRLQIQVLDDSTDETTSLAMEAVRQGCLKGLDVSLIHRENREGYKAGALANAMPQVRGEFVAIFDADFVPQPDFLQQVMPRFREGVGMLQARWGHINRERTVLTRLQAILLDSHFVVEQAARSMNGLWFNFNGTAGVWRVQAILEAGGWSHDTLTEDLDLSYRAQLAGWNFG